MSSPTTTNETSFAVLAKALAGTKQDVPLRMKELLAARQRLLKPHLESFRNLDLFGSLKCLQREDEFHAIQDDDPVLAEGSLPLATHGIFGRSPQYFPGRAEEERHFYFWGLLRSAEWVIAVVHYRQKSYGTTKGNFVAQTAVEVNVKKVKMDRMLRLSRCPPEDILAVLSRAAEGWSLDEFKRARKIGEVMGIIRADEALLLALRKANL